MPEMVGTIHIQIWGIPQRIQFVQFLGVLTLGWFEHRVLHPLMNHDYPYENCQLEVFRHTQIPQIAASIPLHSTISH